MVKWWESDQDEQSTSTMAAPQAEDRPPYVPLVRGSPIVLQENPSLPEEIELQHEKHRKVIDRIEDTATEPSSASDGEKDDASGKYPRRKRIILILTVWLVCVGILFIFLCTIGPLAPKNPDTTDAPSTEREGEDTNVGIALDTTETPSESPSVTNEPSLAPAWEGVGSDGSDAPSEAPTIVSEEPTIDSSSAIPSFAPTVVVSQAIGTVFLDWSEEPSLAPTEGALYSNVPSSSAMPSASMEPSSSAAPSFSSMPSESTKPSSSSAPSSPLRSSPSPTLLAVASEQGNTPLASTAPSPVPIDKGQETSSPTQILNGEAAETETPSSQPSHLRTTANPTALVESSPGVSETPTSVRKCNGLASNCSKRVNEIMYAALHNAMSTEEDVFYGPSHLKRLEGALEAGYRGLIIESCDCGVNGIQLCTSLCLTGTRDPVRMFSNLVDFMNRNINEVVIVEIKVNDESLYRMIDMLGMVIDGFSSLMYSHPGVGVPWPELNELIDKNQRLIVFQHGGPDCTLTNTCQRGIHNTVDYMSETPSNLTGMNELLDFDKSCTIQEGSSSSDFLISNHYTYGESGVAEMAIGLEENSEINITNRLNACKTRLGRDTNLLVVDYWSIGDALKVVQEHNARLGQHSRYYNSH